MKSSGRRGIKTKYLWINLFREIAHTFPRFLSIFAISFIGVSFFTGIRASGPDMQVTVDAYLKKAGVSDIHVFSSAGITDDDLEQIREIDGVKLAEPSLATDVMMEYPTEDGTKEVNMHLISMPFGEKDEYPAKLDFLPDYGIKNDGFRMNIPELTEGRFPENEHEITLDNNLKEQEIAVNDAVTLTGTGGSKTLYITGFCTSGQYISTFDRGNSTVGNGSSDGYAYVGGNVIGSLTVRMPLLSVVSARYSSCDILLEDSYRYNCFSEEYKQYVERIVKRIEAYGETTDATWYVQTREEVNPGYQDYASNTERIQAVGTYFPLIFLLVAMLVALTTMTRMVEDQRTQMGTLKALGYRQRDIVLQYLMYAVLASFFGSILGASFGFWLFPTVIGGAYSIIYRMPDFQKLYWVDITRDSVLLIVGGVTLAAAFVSGSTLREVPANLMRPKAPKPGKRVLIERITFLWKRLGFTTKVTIRNLFRYKKRFLMCIVGIAGSCGLIVTGFGLSDSIFGIITEQFENVWSMNLQMYTYEAMPVEDIREMVDTLDDGNAFYDTAYCYDKTASAGNQENTGTDIHIFVAENKEDFQKNVHLKDKAGNTVQLDDGGAVITEKLAENHHLEIGDTLTVKTADRTYTTKVCGIAKNYVYHYAFFTPESYSEMTGESVKYNVVYTNISGFENAIKDGSPEIKARESEWKKHLLSDDRIYMARFLTDIYDTIWDSLSILNYVVYVLVASAAALTFVVMLNLTNINITERRRELATLRVLGFTDKEMYDYVFRENNVLAVIGTLAGLVLGKYMHLFVVKTCEVDMVMFVRRVTAFSYLKSAVLSVAFALLVNLLMRKKVRSIDMVESLKSVD